MAAGAGLLLGLGALSACDEQAAVERQIDQARVLLGQGDTQAAIAELKRALQATPEDADLRLMLGQVYLSIGDLPYAEKELGRAHALRPKAPDVALAQGELWLRQERGAQVLQELAPQADWPESAHNAALNLRARAYLGLGDAAGAHGAYQAILEAEPDDVDARIGQIRIALHEDDLGASERLLADALRIAPDHATLLGLQGDLAFRLARYPDAVGTYRKQVDMAAGSGTARLALAEALIAAGELAEAGALLDAVLAKRPGNGLARYLRAAVAYQSGDVEGARVHSERALAAIPAHVPSMFIAGASSYELGRLEAAHWNLEKVLAREPNHASARLLLAATDRQLERAKSAAADAAGAGEDLFRVDLAVVQGGELADPSIAEQAAEAARRARAGDHGQATRIIARLESAAPDDPSILELDGGLAVLAGRPQAAVRAFEAALEQRPIAALARKLALAHWRAGDSARSEATLEAWLARAPDDLETRLSLADLHLAADRPAAARDQLTRVVASRPTGASALNNLAWALLEEGRPRAARAYAERALDLAPDEPRVMDTLALVLTEQGELDRAVELFQRAARAETRYPGIEAHLARALAERGDRAAAQEILVRLLGEPGTLPAREQAAAEALLRDLGS